jgi:hypothetical protein
MKELGEGKREGGREVREGGGKEGREGVREGGREGHSCISWCAEE